MAKMTKELAAPMSAEMRAEILFRLDQKLRREIQDEEIFLTWLAEGLPDDVESVEDVKELHLTAEEFAEMWNLAEDLLNADAEER